MGRRAQMINVKTTEETEISPVLSPDSDQPLPF